MQTDHGRIQEALLGEQVHWFRRPVWAMHRIVGSGCFKNVNRHIWGTAEIFGHDKVMEGPIRCPICSKVSSQGTSHYLGLSKKMCNGVYEREAMWGMIVETMQEVYESHEGALPIWLQVSAGEHAQGAVGGLLEEAGVTDAEVAAVFLGAWPMGIERACEWGKGEMVPLLKAMDDYLWRMHSELRRAVRGGARPMMPTRSRIAKQYGGSSRGSR